MKKTIFEKIIEITGTQVELVKRLNLITKKRKEKKTLTPQALTRWRKQIPADRVIDIETAVNGKITRHQMRPDIFGKKKGG